MAVLQATGISDLVNTAINELNRLRFTDITSDLQRHIAMSRLMKKNKVIFDAGPQIQWDLMTDNNNSARWVGLYAEDQVNVPNVMIQGKIDWRHITWNWAIDRREIAMNARPAKIVDLALTRRIASFISAVESFENRFWRVPASSDITNPYGVPYYIVKNNTEGFNGTTPSGYTVVANINPTTYPRWANWTNQYTVVSKDDLIRKMRKAAEFTYFEPPVEMPTFDTGEDLGLYTNYAVWGATQEILESQNNDLGDDLAPMDGDGKVKFRRSPLVWVPALEVDTTNPVYGIQWGEFKTAGLKGEWLRETRIPIHPGQHTVSESHTDCTLNWMVRNRRRHFVIATNTTLPA